MSRRHDSSGCRWAPSEKECADSRLKYIVGMSWQSTNLQAAAGYLRERIAAGDSSPRTKAIYDGLLEVLDPTRRATRVQREMASATKMVAAAAAAKFERERGAVQRRGLDRRRMNLGSPNGVERRRGDRRIGADRRKRG
jgi:hypothetical protein